MEVSFYTFAIGSILNIASFLFLRHKRSTISNIVIYWQYTLLMQIPEGIAWAQINSNQNIDGISKVAMILNVFQPFVLMLVVKYGLNVNIKYAGVANFMYFALLLSNAEDVWNTDITPGTCQHLELRYWDTSRTTLYMLASLISFWEIPDKYWASVNIAIFLGAFFIALLITSCGVGSLFCWIVSLSGIVLISFHYTKNCKIYIDEGALIIGK